MSAFVSVLPHIRESSTCITDLPLSEDHEPHGIISGFPFLILALDPVQPHDRYNVTVILLCELLFIRLDIPSRGLFAPSQKNRGFHKSHPRCMAGTECPLWNTIT